eukprot:TRINITY_DN66801_c2_g1_i3.p1 TRINITY_DN66801_c2_g1~~TRINITY_DN66801_c2_g1_i3.p1  ORF type:complete len:271 (+),score=20.65 TRINITY_DN66801_c2_g1_i3:124-936(+)
MEFKRQRSILESNMAKHIRTTGSKKISLDIGGTTFNTTEETLLKHEDTFFWGMLRSGAWEPDKDSGQYFIDRSPHMFGVILDYLRDGQVRVASHEQDMFRTELDFYQITLPTSGPDPTLRWDADTDAAGVSIHCDQTVLAVFEANDKQRVKTTPCRQQGDITCTLAVFGRPEDTPATFYFTHVGIRLLTGEVSYDLGRTWVNKFADLQDDLSPSTFREYKFSVNCSTLKWTVTWPTGDTKALTLDQPPPYGALLFRKIDSAVFMLNPRTG